MPARPKGASARDSIRAFLLKNLGRVIAGEELRNVSGGISEWARRVRELRDKKATKSSAIAIGWI
jgi:hypothetical protein